MSETIPDDIGQAVQALYRDVMFSTPIAAIDILSRALLAERERAAKIAEGWVPKEEYASHDHYGTGLIDAGERIAKAIRS